MATASLPVQVLRGLYLGVLTGIVPALVAWSLGFLFRYVTGITAPSFGIVVLGVAIAGVNGGFLAFNDPAIIQSANSVTLVTALLVVMMGSFYAHNRGDALGASAPRRFSIRALREKTLSADVVEWVGGRGQVPIVVTGTVSDLEGHPPLPDSTRQALAGFEARLPSDLPVPELEARFADRLRGAHELGDVSVTIDERGHAQVAAAPPISGVSKRVDSGDRAVSLNALLPTGLDRGDDVAVHIDGGVVEGTVVSARVDGAAPVEGAPAAGGDVSGEGTPSPAPPPSGTRGGQGRLTVAVDRTDAGRLLTTDSGRVVVAARGRSREFELASLLRRGGGRIQRLTVGAESPLVGKTLREAELREDHGVVILAMTDGASWRVAPGGNARLSAGQELFAAGPRQALTAFREVLG